MKEKLLLWVITVSHKPNHKRSFMKPSKADLRRNTHSLPELRFEEQDLTSFSGLVLFQALFGALRLKERLQACVRHLPSSSSYGPSRMLLVLLVHLILGWRRLRDLAYYQNDPLVLLYTLYEFALPAHL